MGPWFGTCGKLIFGTAAGRSSSKHCWIVSQGSVCSCANQLRGHPWSLVSLPGCALAETSIGHRPGKARTVHPLFRWLFIMFLMVSMNLFIAFRHITTSYTSQIIRCIPLQVFDSFPPSYQCSPSVKAARLLGKIMPNFWPVSSCPARCWWDTRRLWTTGTTRIWMPSMNPTGPSLRDGSLRPKQPGDHGDLSLFSIGELGCWGFIFGIWIICGLFMDDLIHDFTKHHFPTVSPPLVPQKKKRSI